MISNIRAKPCLTVDVTEHKILPPARSYPKHRPEGPGKARSRSGVEQEYDWPLGEMHRSECQRKRL